MAKTKGIYMMTETGCLQAYSGAFMHITTGLRHLSNHFDMTLLVNKGSLQYVDEGKISGFRKEEVENVNAKPVPRWKKENKLWGVLRDLKLLWNNHKEIFYYYKKLKKQKPDFIYLRSAYLNFCGIIVAKLLKIPLFYEVNGVLANDIQDHYQSYFNPIARYLEKAAYNRSKLAFCVGGVGKIMGLHEDRSISINNGVELDFLREFQNHHKNLDYPLNMGFIGHLMEHHKIEVLFDAMMKLENPKKVHFHFIGGGIFSEKLKDLPSHIQYTYHGIIPHHDLGPYLKLFHIGLIPATQPVVSYMKLYTYAAGKMLSIIPAWPNFKETFSDDLVMYFEPDNSDQLAERMNQVISDPGIMTRYGENLYDFVLKNATWEKIFEFTAKHIEDRLPVYSKELEQAAL